MCFFDNPLLGHDILDACVVMHVSLCIVLFCIILLFLLCAVDKPSKIAGWLCAMYLIRFALDERRNSEAIFRFMSRLIYHSTYFGLSSDGLKMFILIGNVCLVEFTLWA